MCCVTEIIISKMCVCMVEMMVKRGMIKSSTLKASIIKPVVIMKSASPAKSIGVFRRDYETTADA